MSDLTAAQWSKQTVAHLHEYEKDCADVDLFCVGYLIPPVELLELEHSQRSEIKEVWNQVYLEFVEQCMQEDQMKDDDCRRIRAIIKKL